MSDQTLRYNIVVDASSVEKSINGVISDLQAAEKNALKLSNAVLNSFEENAHKSTDAVNASTTRIKREIQDATKDMKTQYAASFAALKKQIADLSGEQVSDSMRANLNKLLEDTKVVMQRTAISMSRIGADYSKEVERQFKEYKAAADARLEDEKRAEEVAIAYAQHEQELARQNLKQIEDCYEERDKLREQELASEIHRIEEVNKYEREQAAEQERISKEGLQQVLDKNKEILEDEKRAEEVAIAYAQYEQEQERQILQQIEDCYRERDKLREQELSSEIRHIEEVNKYEREQVAEQERLSKEGLKQVLAKNKEILEDEKKRAKEEERLAKEAAKAEAQAQKEREKAAKDAEKARIQALKNEDNAWKSLASTISSVVVAIGAVKLSKEFIQSASDAERALFGLGKIFGDVRDEAQAVSETLADMYAMSKTESAQALVGASKMLDAFGFENKVLLSLSSNLVGLSADLSAFTGGMVSAETAMTSLQSALMGNYRTLKETFRVGISSDAINKIAKRWGLMSENLSDAQKVLLRYQAIVEATENVNGSFAESQDSLYVTQQKLKASWEDLSVSLGEQLVPVVTDFLDFINSLVKGVDSLGTGFKTLIAGAFGLLALVSIIPKVISAVAKLTAALRALGVAESFAQGGVIGLVSALGILAVTAVVTAITTAAEATDKVAESTNAAAIAADEYVAAAEREKKAADDITRALDEQAKIRARNDAVMEAQNALSAYGKTSKSFDKKSTVLSERNEEAQRYIDKLARFGEDSPFYKETLADLNNFNELILSPVQDEFDEVAAKFIEETKELAQMYAKLKMSNEDGFFDDILDTIKAAIAPNALPLFTNEVNKAIAAASGLDTDVKELVQSMQFNEQNWTKMLATASTKLAASQLALEKASDEYRKIRDDAREALLNEYNGYVGDIEQRLNVLRAALATEAENTEAYTATTEEINRLEEQKEQAKKWYDDMYEYYGNVYSKNVMDAAEKLETKLAALVYKREQSITEQEEQTVSDLKTKWEDYAKTFNASIGGSTDIGSVGTSRSSLDAYIASIRGMEGVTEETITKLTLAWETYYGSLGDIEEYYANIRKQKMRELEDDLLAVELSAMNLSENEQYALQQRQLNRQHEAELEELAREYSDAAEYADMKAVLEDKHRKENENAEKEHQKRLTEIAISEATSRINRIANAVSSANMNSYDASRVKWAGGFALSSAQRGNRAESRFSALGYDAQTSASMQAVVLNAESKLLSATTAEEEENIKAEMYDELYKLAVNYADNLADLRSKIRQESLNDVNLTYTARMELEMKNLEDEKKEALGAIADKNSAVYNLTKEWYEKRISNLESTQTDELEKIARAQNKALVDAQTALLDSKTAIYEAERNALVEEMNYELSQAEKTGKDAEAITNTYNAKIEKLEKDHLTEMANIAREQNNALISAQTALLDSKLAIYVAEKNALVEEMNYELSQAEKTGKDRVLIENTYNAKIEKLTKDYNTEMANIAREQNKGLIDSQTALLDSKTDIYKAERDALVEEMNYELSQAEKTGKDKELVTETYNNKIAKLDKDYSTEMANIARAQNKELTDAQNALLDSKTAIYEAEKKVLEDEMNYELSQAEKTGKDKETITKTYNAKIEKLAKDHLTEMKNIAREQDKALIDAQTALLYGKTALYEAERNALKSEMNYELSQAEKTGKDKVKITETYNAQLRKLERDHFIEMKAISRQYREDILNSQAANNAARGGWLDLVSGAISRRDASRSQVSMGLTDYIGNIDGINQSRFQTHAALIDNAFNKMLDDSMMVGSKKSQEEMQQELKDKLREILDDVGYAGEDFELIWGNVWAKIEANTKSEWDSIEEIINDSLSRMSDILGKMDTLYTMAESNRMQNLQNMLTDLQNQRDKLEKEASDSGRNLTRKEQDELKRRQALYEEQLEKQEELIKQQKKRQFEREKQFAIAEATIQGLQSAVKSFSDNGGWPWGVAAAALSAAFTGAQIAMIKAQPMPSYAQGAYELPEDQTAQVHKGEMIVPKPFAEEIRDNGGFGGITVNVYGAGDDAVVESSTDSDGIQQLDVFVSGKVKRMVVNGELDTALQSRYTLSRNGRRG